MKISETFPSKYLKAADLQGREVRVTMANVELEQVSDKDAKPVVYFKGKERGVVLNKTNSSVIASAYGDDTEEWFGQDIILLSVMTDFQGKATPGLRVRIPTTRYNTPAPKATANGSGHDTDHPAPRRESITSGPQRVVAETLDDEIPF